jgi:gliding motility-associated-like protein
VSVSIIDSTDLYYQYNLDNSIAQNNGIFTDLAVGEHTITVNNEHNCSGTITFTIEPFTPPNCDDNLCNTTDTYNEQTCECEHIAIETPLCDDNNPATIDTYDPNTCECLYTPAYKIQIPNAFSPNMDGVNDLFGIAGMGMANMHLIIYNRWGVKVFEATNINETWDGNYKGQSQEIGVYAYLLTYSFLNEPDKSYFQKGNITLIK